MVFLVGVLAAVALGAGWVLQQRMAASAEHTSPLSVRLLRTLVRRPTWWLGIAAMVVGQVLGAWALQLSSVTLVESILSTYLLFAFVFAAVTVHWRPRWQELTGAALLSAALGVFIAVGHPRPTRTNVAWPAVLLAVVCVAAAVGLLVAGARRCGAIAEAVLLATAAGSLYGLQDASTRGVLLAVEHDGFAAALHESSWPYVIVGAAVVGIVLAQSAFRAARLDYSLPPAAAAEPLVGSAIGIALLGDRITLGPSDVAVECACVLAMVGGAVLIGRSPALGRELHLHHPRGHGDHAASGHGITR